MLCQLVCVDRRYQRMNCFNIRELQGILKRKFFTDLVNTSDSHKAMDSTLISMRHKNNMSNILLYDQSLFYNFDLTNTSKYKHFNYKPGKIYSYATNSLFRDSNSSSYFYNKMYYLNNPLSLVYVLKSLLKDLISFICIPTYYSLSSVFSSLHFLPTSLTSTFQLKSFNSSSFSFIQPTYTSLEKTNSEKSYISSNLNYSTFNLLSSSNFAENSSS
jgi:hypothetical protein